MSQKIFCAKNFCAFFLHDKVKKPSNAIFGKTVGNFGNPTPPSPPISGPCASFWIYDPKLYLDSKWVKIAIFVKIGLFSVLFANSCHSKTVTVTKKFKTQKMSVLSQGIVLLFMNFLCNQFLCSFMAKNLKICKNGQN